MDKFEHLRKLGQPIDDSISIQKKILSFFLYSDALNKSSYRNKKQMYLVEEWMIKIIRVQSLMIS